MKVKQDNKDPNLYHPKTAYVAFVQAEDGIWDVLEISLNSSSIVELAMEKLPLRDRKVDNIKIKKYRLVEE